MLRYYESSTHETVYVAAPVWLNDDFIGKAVDATNDWTVAGVNSGTFAINAATGGTGRITTGGADDDDVDVASLLTWKASKGCCCEARIALNDADATAFNFGFTDATGEAADLIPLTYATATLTSTATDCAMFFSDPDATTDFIGAVAVIADTDGTVIDSGSVAADGVYHIYRVEIDDLGNVNFYVDGVGVGSQALGITTTTALCVYVGLINREVAANTADVDYIRAWQKR